MLMGRQFVQTLIFMPMTSSIWFAAGTLFAAPAVWLTDFLLSNAYPNIIEAAGLQGVEMMIRTQFGGDGGVIMAATDAGNQSALEINTRLVSYSIAYYAALMMASNRQDAVYKFCIGLFWLWVIMAFGLASIQGKDLLLMVDAPFLNAPGVPPAGLFALTYQFNVLLMPTLASVCLWF
jgi:hypothetical protein